MRKMSSEKFKEGLTVAKLSFQRIQNTKSVIDIMEKDAHLVAAALQYHKIIISLENKALMHFTINYTAINSSIGDVMWVNPSDVGSADIIRWLSGGCATVDEWKISNYSSKAK